MDICHLEKKILERELRYIRERPTQDAIYPNEFHPATTGINSALAGDIYHPQKLLTMESLY